MKSFRFLSLVTALIIIISLLCMWFYPSVQDFMESNNVWNGIKNFAVEFNAANIDSLDELPDSPEGTVLIVIPYIQYDEEGLSKVKRFVDEGGTLFLMDDYGFGNGVLGYFAEDVHFSNKPLLDPLFCFKNQRMPRIIDFSTEMKAAGVEALMLNHPTALDSTGEAEVIAWSSGASFLDLDENSAQSPSDPKGPFPIAVRFQSGKGTVVAVSDPSILTNNMVGRDNNYLFLNYLMSPRGEKTSIIIDRSHIIKSPLDISKIRLAGARRFLTGPYGQLGIIAILFAVVARYTLKKGQLLG